MKSLKELEKEVFDKLSKYPKMEAFFRDSLEERMRINDCWTENALVLILLDDEFFKQAALHTLIDPLHNDQKNFNTLRCKLNPRDEYDEKIRDVLAELNGYYHLLESGFEKIEALPEEDQRKTPDFFAEFNGQGFLFEVKNIRAPVEVCDLLFVKTEARQHRFPEIYESIIISYTLSAKWRQIEFNRKEQETNDLRKQIENWLNEIFSRIESSKPQSLPQFSPTTQDLVIQCRLHQGPKFGQAFGFIDYVNVDDPVYRKSILSPFENKIRSVSCHASHQLLEYDETNQHKKYVLLNWQQRKESTIDIWDAFENDVDEIVKRGDTEFKNLSHNLFVRLLNVDALP